MTLQEKISYNLKLKEKNTYTVTTETGKNSKSPAFNKDGFLANKDARYYAGKDADGKSIFKSKNKPYAPATINRYAAAIGALISLDAYRNAGRSHIFPSLSRLQ